MVIVGHDPAQLARTVGSDAHRAAPPGVGTRQKLPGHVTWFVRSTSLIPGGTCGGTSWSDGVPTKIFVGFARHADSRCV